MKLGHILFKTKNLKNTVKDFEDIGYHVEYGSKKNPHNALIYFSEGPYVELLEKAPVSAVVKLLLRTIGKGKVAERLESWEKAKEGYFEICLENEDATFEVEKRILKRYDIGYFITQSKRKDPFNRTLKWTLLFPLKVQIPFFMSAFNYNPKPKNFIHPNGVIGIGSISYGIPKKLKPLVSELCDDKRLNLFSGRGIKNLVFQKHLISNKT